MPLLLNNTNPNAYVAASGHKYSAVGTDMIGSITNTLVQIAIDETGSVTSYVSDLEAAVSAIIRSCQKSPESESILIRVTAFNSRSGIREIHGFVPLSQIDASAYSNTLNPGSMTNLCDAAYDMVETTKSFGQHLVDNEYTVNSILFVITDGGENASSNASFKTVAESIKKLRTDEIVESVQTIVIGVNDSSCKADLETFKSSAGFDQYISVGEATPSKLAKLANFISQSMSATSQVIGTGGPSQLITPTF